MEFIIGFILFALFIKLFGGKIPSKSVDNSSRDNSETTCKYCDSASIGGGCAFSPSGRHEHNTDHTKCESCGSASYGRGCAHSSNNLHRHGIGNNQCRWCGSHSIGGGCAFSPSGRHEK